MEFSNVTFASDDERNLKHTKVFLNKNLFHCYHNNRGFCSFRDNCKYQHYKDICSKTICREKECKRRHPVICRYKDECKFHKTNSCAFKHIERQRDVDEATKDFETERRIYAKEIETLKNEINDLKKEKEITESKREIQNLNLKLIPIPSNQQLEQNMGEEIYNLKKQIDILVKENESLKIKIVPKDQSLDVHTAIRSEDKDNIKLTTKYSCELCCLNFSKVEKSNKHKNEMHKSKLPF